MSKKNEYIEAEWFGYFAKLKPGSRHGTGGRKMRTDPPWTIDRNVSEGLKFVKYGSNIKFSESSVSKLHSLVSRDVAMLTNKRQEIRFCRKIPFAMVKSLPYAAIIADNHDINDLSIFAVCSEIDARCSAHDLCGQNAAVLIAVNVSVDFETLQIALPLIDCLILSSNSLSTSSAVQLFATLSENHSVRTLAVTENSLSDDSCRCIPKCLCNNEKITSLHLSANEIGDDGAKMVAEALMPCRCQDLMALAISEDQVHAFVLLLRHGYPLYSGSVNLLLEKTVMSGSVGIAEYLIDQNAEVTRVASDSRSLLHRAACQGHVRMVDLLLSKSADIFHRDSQGRTALIEASRNGHGDVVFRLIEYSKSHQMKVDITIQSLEVLPKKLLPQTTTVKRKGSLLSWFSFESVETSSATRVEDKDGESSAHQGTPEIEIPADCGTSQVLDLEFNHFKHRITVPVSEAVQIEMRQVVSFLLSAGFPASQATDFQGVKLVLILLQDNGNELVIGKGQFSILTSRSRRKSDQGYWVHLHDEADSIIASIRLETRLSSTFLDQSCKLGHTALLEACRKGYSDSARTLLENSADADCTDQDGNTPLIICSRFGFEDICKLLLSFGASTQTSNRAGITAFMAAQQHSFTNIAQILLCHEKIENHIPLSVKRIHPENTSLLDQGPKYTGDYKKCAFELVIVGAQNLPVADVTGLSDPYCRISVNTQQKRTRVLNRNLNPRWNQTFVFEDQCFSAWERSDIAFEVLDSNMVSASTLLGKRRLEISRLMSQGIRSNEGEGWIFASFFLENEDGKAVRDEQSRTSLLHTKFRFSERRGQYLAVSVWGALNLPFTKARNAQSSCLVQYGDQAVETPLSPRTTNVTWNTHFSFKAPAVEETLIFEIRDNYSSKSGATEIKYLAKIEIMSNVLAYLIDAQLKELEFEIYALDGTTLKGPGGHISSLRVNLDLVVYDSPYEKNEEFKCNLSGPPLLPRQLSVIQYEPIGFLSGKSEEYPSPRIKELETQFDVETLSTGVIHDGKSNSYGQVTQVRHIVLFNKILSSFTDSDLLFLNSIHRNNHLVTLHLDQNKISDIGATYISRSLQRNRVLQTLSLNENKIGVDGATSIGQCLAVNSQLSQLDISKNRIKDEGLREICRALVNNKSSKVNHLNVSENNIGAVGMRFLARLLAHSNLLEILAIGNNCIGPDGALLLSQGLRKNSSIKALDISFAVLGDVGVNYLAQSLKNKARILGKMMPSNKSLQSINISGNGLSQKSVSNLLDCMQNNRTVQKIIIDDNGITPEVIQALKDCIEQNVKAAQLERAVVRIQKAYRLAAQGRFRRENKGSDTQKKCHIESLFDNRETEVSKVGTDSELEGQVENFNSRSSNLNEDDNPTFQNSSGTTETQVYNSSHSKLGHEANENLKDMLVAATTFTLFNLGDAVLLEHEAAYAIAQEAAAKLSAAADNYSRLEDHFYQLMMNENSDQDKIVFAVHQLTAAREEILRAIEDSKLAEEAAAKCFLGAEAFVECEKEKENLLEAVKETITLDEAVDGLQVGMIQSRSVETTKEVIISQHESTINTESDDEIISSALEEFVNEGSGTMNMDQTNDDSEAELSAQRDLDIEVCCSIALEELESCKLEIQQLRQILVVDTHDSNALDKMAAVAFADHRCSILEERFHQLLMVTHSLQKSKYVCMDGFASHNLEEELICAALKEFVAGSSLGKADQRLIGTDAENGSTSILDKDIDTCCTIIKKEMELCKLEIAELREHFAAKEILQIDFN